eukprot:359938-Chlamydomonas_euryale.AAC.10
MRDSAPATWRGREPSPSRRQELTHRLQQPHAVAERVHRAVIVALQRLDVDFGTAPRPGDHARHVKWP